MDCPSPGTRSRTIRRALGSKNVRERWRSPGRTSRTAAIRSQTNHHDGKRSRHQTDHFSCSGERVTNWPQLIFGCAVVLGLLMGLLPRGTQAVRLRKANGRTLELLPARAAKTGIRSNFRASRKETNGIPNNPRSGHATGGLATRGHEPLRAALLLTAAGMGGAVYAVRMAAVAAKAKRLRAERGIPEPSARQLDGGQDHNDQA